MTLSEQLQTATSPLIEVSLDAVKGWLDDDGERDAKRMADKAFDRQVREGETKIALALKAVAREYLKILRKASGRRWKAKITNDLMSMTSLDGKLAVDLYWEYDPLMDSATITVEGPKGRMRSFTAQKMKKIGSARTALDYLWWLADVLKESREIRETLRLMAG